MTKPAASAPPADAFERAMKASWEMVNPRDTSAPGSYYAGLNSGMIAALQTVRDNYKRELAASAQGREVEALRVLMPVDPTDEMLEAIGDFGRSTWYAILEAAGYPAPDAHQCDRCGKRTVANGEACGFPDVYCLPCWQAMHKPAPEPAPVAQGDMAGRLEGLARALQRRGYPDNAKLIRDAIADHASTVAELEKDVLDMADKAIDAYIQRDTAEASLAACRADAERWQYAREHLLRRSPGNDMGGQHRYCPTPNIHQLRGPTLDAAIDATRAVLPLAGEVAK